MYLNTWSPEDVAMLGVCGGGISLEVIYGWDVGLEIDSPDRFWLELSASYDAEM